MGTFTDAFTDTDTTTLTAHNAGWIKSSYGAAMTIASNAVTNISDYTTYRYDSFTPAAADYGAWWNTAVGAESSKCMSLALRVDSSSDKCYLVRWGGSGGWETSRQDGQFSHTQVGITAGTAPTSTTKIGGRVEGTGATVTVKIYAADALVATHTDSSASRITITGKAGCCSDFANSGSVDDFNIDDDYGASAAGQPSISRFNNNKYSTRLNFGRWIAGGR